MVVMDFCQSVKSLQKSIEKIIFQEVNFDPKSTRWIVFACLCVPVLGISFFAGVQVVENHGRETFQMFHGESVLAAKDENSDIVQNSGNNVKGKNTAEVMLEAANLVKSSVRKARAQKIIRQRVANLARLEREYHLDGTTIGLTDGKQICSAKNDHPSGGGSLHIDEDCCPDPNETPNPRCYYTPAQRGIMQ
jgi:hypothetical protein